MNITVYRFEDMYGLGIFSGSVRCFLPTKIVSIIYDSHTRMKTARHFENFNTNVFCAYNSLDVIRDFIPKVVLESFESLSSRHMIKLFEIELRCVEGCDEHQTIFYKDNIISKKEVPLNLVY